MIKYMMYLTLDSSENVVAFVVSKQGQHLLVTYELETNKLTTLFSTDSTISSVAWLHESLYFVHNCMLIQVDVNTQQQTELFQCEQLQQFSDDAFVFLQRGNIICFNVTSREQQIIATEVDSLIATKGEIIVFKKAGAIYYWLQGELYELTVSFEVLSAALSFDEQYIAFFGTQLGAKQLFVYDIELQILQNMTEMLGATIGHDGVESSLPTLSLEIPAWTETNAFYFLVSANDEVRLYYGDLYGTLLPASPEDECIYDYVIARSGNWAITAFTGKDGQCQLVVLDITTGEQSTIEIY